MDNVISDSDVKIKTLMEYLRVQARSDIADLVVDAKITYEKDPTLVGVVLGAHKYKLYLNVSPAVFHTLQTEPEIKRVLEKSFLEVIPTFNNCGLSSVGFRIMPV